ncbi:hypothetical protein ACWDPP_38710, partial [Streptomyces sp. NPDC000851]
MRENFATRILVRYTLNAWRMLVPQVSPIPMPSEHPGRAQVVTADRAHETQVLNLSNAEAREWAMSGVHANAKTGPALQKPPAPATDLLTDARSQPPVLPAPAPEPTPAAADVLADARRTTPPAEAPELPPAPVPAPDPDDALVGLRKAHQDHLPQITLAALRYARANDPEFPRPSTPLPRRRPQEVGPQPAPRRLRHHRPRPTGPARVAPAYRDLSGPADTILQPRRTPSSPGTAQKSN